jgi:hypothetical protein
MLAKCENAVTTFRIFSGPSDGGIIRYEIDERISHLREIPD